MRPSAAPLGHSRNRRRWPRPVLGSLLIHAVILGLGWKVWQHRVPTAPVRAPMAVRLLDVPVVPPAGPAHAARRPIRQPRPAKAPTASLRRGNEAPRVEPSEPEPLTTEAAAPGRPGESLIRPDTIADAVREAARGTALTQQADERSGRIPVPDAHARLAAGVAAAATTDCLKGGEGGYRSQNYGLLAVPLLIIDAAAGKCRK